MDDAARDELARLCPVSRHVGHGGVRLERGHAFPLFDDEEGIRAPLLLNGERILGVDRRAVLDAAALSAHGRHVGAKRGEDVLALAWLCRDDSDDVDHVQVSYLSNTMSSGARPSPQ